LRARVELARPDEHVARARQHPAQVDEHLLVDVLAARRIEDLDLAAQVDSELAVVLLSRRAQCLE
jgi:hypothetical protein